MSKENPSVGQDQSEMQCYKYYGTFSPWSWQIQNGCQDVGTLAWVDSQWHNQTLLQLQDKHNHIQYADCRGCVLKSYEGPTYISLSAWLLSQSWHVPPHCLRENPLMITGALILQNGKNIGARCEVGQIRLCNVLAHPMCLISNLFPILCLFHLQFILVPSPIAGYTQMSGNL